MNDDATDDPRSLRWRHALVHAGRQDRKSASPGLRSKVLALAPPASAVMLAKSATGTTSKTASSAKVTAAGLAARVTGSSIASGAAETTSQSGAALAGNGGIPFALLGKLAFVAVSLGLVAGASVVLTPERRASNSQSAATTGIEHRRGTEVAREPAVVDAAESAPPPSTRVDDLPPASVAALVTPPTTAARDGVRSKVTLPRERATLEAASAERVEVAATAADQADDRHRLAEEMRQIEKVRTATNGGRHAEALRLLEEYRLAFPAGALAEEAEAMRIEALSRLGRSTAAVVLARRFLKEHPNSPYTTSIEATLAAQTGAGSIDE